MADSYIKCCINDKDCVVLGYNKYDYKNDTYIIKLLKDYKKVQFDNNYDDSIDWLPEGITHLYLGSHFNNSLDNLPSTIKHIIIKKYNCAGNTIFNMPLNKLPQGLETLEICYNTKFNKPLNNLPTSLKKLCMSCFNYKYTLNNLPDSLEYISIKFFDYIKTTVLPKNLKIFDLADWDYINSINYITALKILLVNYPNFKFMYNDIIINL